MRERSSILIHSATGGVGMAAIHMALLKKCTIFATVGSEAKKQLLLEQFPQLDESNIFSSRDDNFEAIVKRKTNEKGVDIVLNSLAGELFDASLRIVATTGHFVEIGKRKFLVNSVMQTDSFLKGISFHAISLDDILKPELGDALIEIMNIMDEHIQKGYIKPIPQRKVFKLENISDAFKYFKTITHTGKILLKVRDEESSPESLPSPKIMKAIPRLFFNPERTYLIVGGLGGLGLELAFFMSLRGAKHIFLNSRSQPKYGYQLNLIYIMRKWGVNVYVSDDDVSNFEDAKNLLMKADKIAPIGGIFNFAMVNRDAILENQTVEDFEAVFKPKAIITKNLDAISRKMCSQLEHFVAFSSVSCGKGNLGQTNYGFANSSMERIIERRIQDKLPGVVIQWGPMADVGYFAKTNSRQEMGTYIAQPVMSYLETLQEFLLNHQGIFFSILLRDIIHSLDAGASLLESVLKLFGITNPEKVKEDLTLLDLGMDSLMGFEVKQYLYREHQIDLSVKDLRNKTIKQIKEIDEKHKKTN